MFHQEEYLNKNLRFSELNIKKIFNLFKFNFKSIAIIVLLYTISFSLIYFDILDKDLKGTFLFFSTMSVLMIFYGTSFTKFLLLKITNLKVFYTPFFNKNIHVNIPESFISNYNLKRIIIKNKKISSILLISQIFDLSKHLGSEKSKRIMSNISLIIAINKIAKNKGLIYFVSLFVYVLMANVLFNFSLMLIVPFNEYSLDEKLIYLLVFTIGFILTLAWFLKIYINVLIEEIEEEMFEDILSVNAKLENLNQQDLIEIVYMINEINIQTNEIKYISFPDELIKLKSDTLNHFNDISKTLIQMAAPITYLAILNILFSVYSIYN